MDLRIGLLGLYVKLYDDKSPEIRAEIENFYDTIANSFEKTGMSVTRNSLCRLKPEFDSAVKSFEKNEVDAIVTLHLAYSPSLESIDSLMETDIPLIVLDTTPDYSFGPDGKPSMISFNHGIHGVQDMCSLLVRYGRKFYIEAGHWQKSDVLKRVSGRVRAIAAAKKFRDSRIGVIGERFPGMGDFLVEPGNLRTRFGIETVAYHSRDAVPEVPAVPGVLAAAEPVRREAEYYRTFMKTDRVPADIMDGNIRAALSLREWVKREKLDGFTFNFLSISRESAIDRVPFLFAAVGMFEGLGYAGEGDVLTAALVAALLKLNPETSFTEMFCPDWEGGRIFLSHMGEINPRVCPETAEAVHKENKYTDASPTVYSTGQFRKGDAILVNLVPMSESEFRLIVCPVSVEEEPDCAFVDSVHGWIRPALPVGDFLRQFSLLGGTHHSALVYGELVETIRTFGETLGFDVRVIDRS